MRPAFPTLRVLASALLVLACGPKDGATRYPITGKIESLDILDREVTVAHEPIEGYMPAMTMPFKMPKDASLLGRFRGLPIERLRRGDVIAATLAVTNDRSWLENVKVLRYEAPPELPVRPPKQSKPGLPLVDVPLVDQDAKPLRFADYKGRAFAITFIYTRCPLPEFCPRTMKGFAALDDAIEAEPALRDRTRLLSISFDTEFDKPEVLKAFGSAYVTDRGQGPFARWRLASGTAADIERLATFLGLVFYKEDGSFTHSMITVIVGPDGKIVRELDGPEWEVADALDALREALGVKKPQATAAASPGAAR